MALPTIAPYPLPVRDDLPAPRAPWRIDAARAALLIHDMQGYFVRRFPGDADPMRSVLSNIGALRERCDALGVPVFYTAQPGRQDPRDRGLQSVFWGPGMTSAPEDQQVVDALAPRPGHTVLVKWRYSAFQRSDFDERLRTRGRDQLIVTGVFAHIGCLLTAAEAFMRDVEPFFVADAVADFTREHHDRAVTQAAACCAVALTTADTLLELSRMTDLTLRRLLDDVARILDVPADEIDPDDNLVDHGLDSIRLMQLAQRWQAAGLPLAFPELAERPQLSYWWTLAQRGASRS